MANTAKSRAQSLGYASEREKRSIERTLSYRMHMKAAKIAQGKNYDHDTFVKSFNRFRNTKSNAPTGIRAKYLVDIGLRSSRAKYPVGQTPPKKKGGRGSHTRRMH